MKREELFSEVRNWLEAGKISFVSEDGATIRFRGLLATEWVNLNGKAALEALFTG